MIANPTAEQMSRDELAELQFARLKKVLEWAFDKSLFYQRKYEDAGIGLEEISSLDDLEKLPFLKSLELHQIDSLDILTVPLSSILRFNYMQEASGEITKLYTNGDIARNVDMMARALVAAGITNASIVGLQGDLADSRLLDVQYALEFIGATVVPLGTDYRHWLRLMEIIGMDTLVSTPQLVMQLTIQLQATGKNIIDYPIDKIICLNTVNIQNPLQHHIEERTRTKVFNLFAPPEIGSGGMLFQCQTHIGQHVQEDFFYPEIVEFGGDTPVHVETRMGELVITTLAAEAMPLIRYRTGQAVSRMTESCACGRTFVRIGTPFSFV